MKKELSLELRKKIRENMAIDELHVGFGSEYSDNYGYCGVLTFKDDEIELYNECIEWRRIIDTYFKTSQTGGMAIRVGRFIGLKPIIFHKSFIEFGVILCEKESWKDWFDTEGENDASKFFT